MNTEKNVIIENNIKSAGPVVTKTMRSVNNKQKSGKIINIRPGQNVEIKKSGVTVGIKFPASQQHKAKPSRPVPKSRIMPGQGLNAKSSYQPMPLREMPRPMRDWSHPDEEDEENNEDKDEENDDNGKNEEPIGRGVAGSQEIVPEEEEDDFGNRLRMLQSQARTGNEVSGETEESEDGEEPDEDDVSGEVRQKKKQGKDKQAMKKQGEEAEKGGLASKAQDKIKEFVKKCWMSAPGSFGLTLFGVQLNMFCRAAISDRIFPELGSEWFPSVVQNKSPEAIEFAAKKIKLTEILIILLYDFIFAIVVGTILFFIILIANFMIKSWWGKLAYIWNNISLVKDILKAYF
jgi:hypothetical protein